MEGTNFIKSEGEIKVEGVEIRGRLREYIVVLLNGENDRELEVVQALERPLHELSRR